MRKAFTRYTRELGYLPTHWQSYAITTCTYLTRLFALCDVDDRVLQGWSHKLSGGHFHVLIHQGCSEGGGSEQGRYNVCGKRRTINSSRLLWTMHMHSKLYGNIWISLDYVKTRLQLSPCDEQFWFIVF